MPLQIPFFEAELLERIAMHRAFLASVRDEPGLDRLPCFGQKGRAEPIVDAFEFFEGIALHILEVDVADSIRGLPLAKLEAASQIEGQAIAHLLPNGMSIHVVRGESPERREHARCGGERYTGIAMGLNDSCIGEDATKIIEETEMLRGFQDPTFSAFAPLLFLPLKNTEHAREKLVARRLILILQPVAIARNVKARLGNVGKEGVLA